MAKIDIFLTIYAKKLIVYLIQSYEALIWLVHENMKKSHSADLKDVEMSPVFFPPV